jgi:hypothetical protein
MFGDELFLELKDINVGSYYHIIGILFMVFTWDYLLLEWTFNFLDSLGHFLLIHYKLSKSIF